MLSEMNIFGRKDPSVKTNRHENEIKKQITAEFSRGLKILQQKQLCSDEAVRSDSEGNNLCNILEAVFLHGLKDSLKHKFTTYMNFAAQSQGEFTLNFWNFVVHFTHGDVVSQLKQLPQITTEIGLSRAWVRVALNDGLMESYIHSVISDMSTLKHYYSSTAYLRDLEQPEILKSFLAGLSSLQFKLSLNSSMLNTWTCTPLILCGVIERNSTPTTSLKDEDAESLSSDTQVHLKETSKAFVKPDKSPFSKKFVVSEFTDSDMEETEQLMYNKYTASEVSSSSPSSCPDSSYTADLAIQPYNHLKMPEQITDLENGLFTQINSVAVTDVEYTSKYKHEENKVCCSEVKGLEKEESSTINNSYSHKDEYSVCDVSACRQLTINCENLKDAISLSPPTSPKCKSGPVKAELSSVVASCIQTHSVPHLSSVRQDIDNIISGGRSVNDFPSVTTSSPRGNSLNSMIGWSSNINEKTPQLTEQNLNFKTSSENKSKVTSFGTLLKMYEPSISLSNSSVDDVIENFTSTTDSADGTFQTRKPSKNNSIYLKQLGELAVEKGLDSQNYQCFSCSRPIGLFYGKSRVCSFNGRYYCFECHENAEFYIPAAILHNWDFQKQKVSRESFEFLVEIEDQPLLNVSSVNPRLYEHVPELAEVQKLRVQLCSLKSYIFSCQQSLAEELRKKIWPREYLYDNIHLFSMLDFLQVPTGQLAKTLREIVKFTSHHVYDCTLCSQKGFICEVCNNPRVIYPFEIDSTYRCSRCKAVYHKTCMVESFPCPKCHRWGLISGKNPLQTLYEVEDYAVSAS